MADDDTTQEDPTTTPPPTDEVAEQIAHEAEGRLMAFDSIPAAARSLRDWIETNLPDEVSTAYWVTIGEHRERDKGIALQVAKIKDVLDVKALLGEWSGGLAVMTRPYDVAQFKMKVAVGAGVVTPYADLGHLEPVVVATLRF